MHQLDAAEVRYGMRWVYNRCHPWAARRCWALRTDGDEAIGLIEPMRNSYLLQFLLRGLFEQCTQINLSCHLRYGAPDVPIWVARLTSAVRVVPMPVVPGLPAAKRRLRIEEEWPRQDLFVPDSYSRACGRRKHLQQLAQIADHLLEKRDISLRYVTI